METPRAREDVLLRPMGKEWVLYDPDSRLLHVLNVAAALTWSSLDGRRGLDEVAREIASEMPRAPDALQVLEDVKAAVERFRAEGLLE